MIMQLEQRITRAHQSSCLTWWPRGSEPVETPTISQLLCSPKTMITLWDSRVGSHESVRLLNRLDLPSRIVRELTALTMAANHSTDSRTLKALRRGNWSSLAFSLFCRSRKCRTSLGWIERSSNSMRQGHKVLLICDWLTREMVRERIRMTPVMVSTGGARQSWCSVSTRIWASMQTSQSTILL